MLIETPRQFLEAGKALIEDPKYWTQGQNKRKISRFLRRGYWQWCSQGALEEIRERHNVVDAQITASALSIISTIAARVYNDCVITVNDRYGHHEVMQMWDFAINLAKEMEIKHLDFCTYLSQPVLNQQADQIYAPTA